MEHLIARNPHLATTKRELDVIVRAIYADLEIWRKSHEEGVEVVGTIHKIRGECVAAERGKNALTSKRGVAEEKVHLHQLRERMRIERAKLFEIVKKLSHVKEQTKKYFYALNDLCLDSDLRVCVFYRNWQLQDMATFLGHISDLYEAEFKIKKETAAHISKSKTDDELDNHRNAWITNTHVFSKNYNDEFEQFSFEMMCTCSSDQIANKLCTCVDKTPSKWLQLF